MNRFQRASLTASIVSWGLWFWVIGRVWARPEWSNQGTFSRLVVYGGTSHATLVLAGLLAVALWVRPAVKAAREGRHSHCRW